MPRARKKETHERSKAKLKAPKREDDEEEERRFKEYVERQKKYFDEVDNVQLEEVFGEEEPPADHPSGLDDASTLAAFAAQPARPRETLSVIPRQRPPPDTVAPAEEDSFLTPIKPPPDSLLVEPNNISAIAQGQEIEMQYIKPQS